MEGGKIIRTIGGESVKIAKKSITLTATEGDLTFNSATKVVMTGKQGGVQYLNNYKPPIPLQEVKIEGPFNEQGDKITVIEKGKSYIYKATEFNRELKSPLEIKQIKWAMQHNDDNLIFASQARGKQEVTLSISESEPSEKITIYAYFENPKQEASIEVSLKTGEPGYIIISTIGKYGQPEKYRFLEGEIYAQCKGINPWDNLFEREKYTEKLKSDVQKIYEDLNLLWANSVGKKLMEFFENGKHEISIIIPIPEQTKGKRINHADENQITYMGELEELPMEGYFERKKVSSYIVLGHEMGHVKSFHLKQQDLSYWHGIMIDELYATHIENKIRAAAGIKLRDKYDGSGETFVIDKEHHSFYFTKNEDNYPKNPPQKIETKNAFNYNSIKKDE